MFLRNGSARNSDMALRELQKQYFVVTGFTKTVFWCDGSARNSVLALQKQCFGMIGVPEVLFLRCRSCENSVFA